MLSLTVVLLISYLLGSVPTSLWMGRLVRGIDIREYGSGNAGATNTFRILGWPSGVVVLSLDFFKGFVSTYWVSQLAWKIGSGPVTIPAWDVDAFVQIACGFVAVFGHAVPVFAGFRGGKGGAAAAGMLYGIEPVSISISVGIFLLVMFTTRYVSLGTVIATAVYPLSQLVLRYIVGWQIDGSVIILSSVASLFIIYKHKSNLQRLVKGKENRIKTFKPRKAMSDTELSDHRVNE